MAVMKTELLTKLMGSPEALRAMDKTMIARRYPPVSESDLFERFERESVVGCWRAERAQVAFLMNGLSPSRSSVAQLGEMQRSLTSEVSPPPQRSVNLGDLLAEIEGLKRKMEGSVGFPAPCSEPAGSARVSPWGEAIASQHAPGCRIHRLEKCTCTRGDPRLLPAPQAKVVEHPDVVDRLLERLERLPFWGTFAEGHDVPADALPFDMLILGKTPDEAIERFIATVKAIPGICWATRKHAGLRTAALYDPNARMWQLWCGIAYGVRP